MVSNRDGSANTIMCPGYFDEEGGFRVSCTFKAPVDSSEIKRKSGGRLTIQSDDDDDDEDADNGTSDGEFAAYADLSSDGSEGRKKAVAVLLDWSKKHSLRMPADSTARKVAVGTILMNHMSGSTFDLKGAAKALRKEFPSAAAEAEKRAKAPNARSQQIAISPICLRSSPICAKKQTKIFSRRAQTLKSQSFFAMYHTRSSLSISRASMRFRKRSQQNRGVRQRERRRCEGAPHAS